MHVTAQAVRARKEVLAVSIQEAVKADQSTQGGRASTRWPPIWALVLMYVVGIGAAIGFGVVFY